MRRKAAIVSVSAQWPMKLPPPARVTASEGRGDPEPLPHPKRELARSLLCHIVQTDQIDQLVHTPASRTRLPAGRPSKAAAMSS
jgi:hypothetical protein